jgi:hypothetical protein
MKLSFLSFLLLFFCTVKAQHQIEKIWESDTTLTTPESVLPAGDILYVSLINGAPWEADGKGGVAKVDRNGKVINASWITGLNAPKGMGISGNRLYVADIAEVVVINTGTGKIEQKIAIEGAQNLNDVTVDQKGVVYVSDSKLGNVHQIINNKPSLYLSGLNRVNGLRAVGNDLYMLTAKEVYKVGKDKKLQTVGIQELGGDGIEPVGNGDFITSTWGGVLYYLHKDGKLETLMDTREQKRNVADIGYDAKQRIIYIPTFFANTVVAYRLK